MKAASRESREAAFPFSIWIELQELLADMKNNPAAYTYWFKLSLEDMLSKR